MWGNRRGGNEHFIFGGIDAVPLVPVKVDFLATIPQGGVIGDNFSHRKGRYRIIIGDF